MSQKRLVWSFIYSVNIVQCQIVPGPELGTDKVKMRKTYFLRRIPRRKEAGGRDGFCFFCPKPSRDLSLLLE